MNGSILPGVLWCAAAAAGVAYTVLFLLARRPAAIRLGRVGLALCVVLAFRLILLGVGHPVATVWEAVVAGVALVGAVGFGLARRVWLVNVTAEEFREQVQMSCRGLFLPCAEAAPGHFLLTAKEGSWPLRLRRLSRRMQLVVGPCPGGRGKATLFVHWLSKQYPGPMPRVRIILKRSEP